MNDRLPPDIRDLHSFIASVPFGVIHFQVNRVNRKTTEISVEAEETLKYVNNDEAKLDLDNFIKSLIDSRYSGEAHVKLEMKDGNIRLIGIFNKKTTKY